MSADAVVIGGGVIGCSIARELALRGARVVVIERGTPGREATWAAAGMLSPLGEAAHAPAFLELAVAGLDRYASFAAALLDATGIDIEYRTRGKLYVVLDEQSAGMLEDFVAHGDAFGVTRLDAEQALGREPSLSPCLVGCVLVRRDHSVNNRRLASAIWAAAAAAGVDFRLGAHARGVVLANPSGARHIEGVRLADGEVLGAGHVVVAAGAWSGELELPARLPVRPVRGQMFAVAGRAGRGAEATGRMHLEHVVMTHDCYIIPRESGEIVVGATVEDVGFERGPTPRGIGALLAAAAAAVPGLADLPLVETWAGFRPGTPDNLPILGADPDLPGLYYATGHFRNGILLAPITADAIADAVTGRAPTVDLGPYNMARFRGGGA